MPELLCYYCNQPETPARRIFQRKDLTPSKLERFLSVKGRFPCCIICRVKVQNGVNPTGMSALDCLLKKLNETDQRKHRIAKTNDIAALRNLANDTANDSDSLTTFERDFQVFHDSIESLPSKIANARKFTAIGHIKKFNRGWDRIRSINAYISQHIVIDYADARRLANAAIRPDWRRANILNKQGGKCRYCGAMEELTIDHILPVFRGGNSNDENLQGLCGTCNARKGAADYAVKV